jgi:hypothetical protein
MPAARRLRSAPGAGATPGDGARDARAFTPFAGGKQPVIAFARGRCGAGRSAASPMPADILGSCFRPCSALVGAGLGAIRPKGWARG